MPLCRCIDDVVVVPPNGMMLAARGCYLTCDGGVPCDAGVPRDGPVTNARKLQTPYAFMPSDAMLVGARGVPSVMGAYHVMGP